MILASANEVLDTMSCVMLTRSTVMLFMSARMNPSSGGAGGAMGREASCKPILYRKLL